MLVDMHFHICNRYHSAKALPQTLADIEENRILVAALAVDLPTYHSTLKRIQDQDLVFPAFGVHPWFTGKYQGRLDEIRAHLDEVGMFGEVGLDYLRVGYSPRPTHELQKQILEVFLSAAEKQDKILNLHVRGASEEAFALLASYDLKRVILHGYSESVEFLREGIERGYYFTLTRKAQGKSCKLVTQHVPDERLLTETDALPKIWQAPSTFLTHTLQVVAEARGVTFEELKRTIHENALRIMKGVPLLEKYTKVLEQSLS